MTNEDKPNKDDEKQEVVATPKENVDGLIAIAQAVVTPYMQVQETAEKEETKRESIRAEVTGKLINRVFYIGLAVLVIAGMALFKGDSRITESIVIALVAFLGGVGFGRTSATNKTSS